MMEYEDFYAAKDHININNLVIQQEPEIPSGSQTWQ